MVTGALGESIAWHYGFGAAGRRDAGLAGDLSQRPQATCRRIRRAGAKARADGQGGRVPMTRRDWQVVILLVLLLPVLALSIVGNNQIHNAYLLWADKQRRPAAVRLQDADQLAGVGGFRRLRGHHGPGGLVLAAMGQAVSASRTRWARSPSAACSARRAWLCLAVGATVAGGEPATRSPSAGCCCSTS